MPIVKCRWGGGRRLKHPKKLTVTINDILLPAIATWLLQAIFWVVLIAFKNCLHIGCMLVHILSFTWQIVTKINNFTVRHQIVLNTFMFVYMQSNMGDVIQVSFTFCLYYTSQSLYYNFCT